jgi:hypothetical protein
MEPKHRPATLEEVVESLKGRSQSISFRHFAKEQSFRRAGAFHTRIVTQGRSKARLIDGKPYVMHQGRLQPITATHCTLPDGKTFIWDYRLDSPHLPTGF